MYEHFDGDLEDLLSDLRDCLVAGKDLTPNVHTLVINSLGFILCVMRNIIGEEHYSREGMLRIIRRVLEGIEKSEQAFEKNAMLVTTVG